MDLVGRLFLRVVHFFYSLFLAILSIRSRYSRPTPTPLTATRSKIPSHLALVLVSQEPDLCISDAQESFLRCTEKAIACCRAAGVQRLSVYDRQGSFPHRDVVQSSQ
jgi:dehydrodolichyl diphosphate syntase complex subunit NUS1